MVDQNDVSAVAADVANPQSPVSYLHGDVNFSGTIDSIDNSFENGLLGHTLSQLNPPTSPSASATTNSVSLQWTASTSQQVNSYDIYRNFQFLANTGSPSYTDNGTPPQGLPSNTTYTYFVVARDSAGDSSYNSPEVTAKTTTPVPNTPTNLKRPNKSATSRSC